MPQHCLVCEHPKAAEINTLLLGSGRSKREIAASFSLPEGGIYRHAKNHLAEQVARVIHRHEVTKAGKELKINREELANKFHERVEYLWDKTSKAVERAETAVKTAVDRETGELYAVGSDLAVIGPLLAQAHKNQELLGKAAGVLTESVQQQPAGGAQISVTVPVMIAPGTRVEHGRIRAETGQGAIEASATESDDTPR